MGPVLAILENIFCYSDFYGIGPGEEKEFLHRKVRTFVGNRTKNEKVVVWKQHVGPVFSARIFW